MSDHMVFQGCTGWEKEAIRSYWLQKMPRIERLLTRFPEDQRELRLTATRKPKRFEVRAALLLPTGSLVAEASSSTDRDAVDAVASKLAGVVRRHKEVIRREHLYRKKQHREELSRRVEALLEPQTEKLDQNAFFDLLAPLMARLRDHAHRELTLAQFQGQIGQEEVTVNDLLDETILRAWTQLDRRDLAVPLDVWLTRLLHDVLDEQTAHAQGVVSLDGEVDGLDAGREAAAGRLPDDAPVWEEPQTVTFDDVLPSREVAEPWEKLAAIDQMRWVLDQLSEVASVRRRAFTLHLLDGWEPEDVAMIQSRSVAEVRADIEAVQEMLQRRMDGQPEVSRSGIGSARRGQ
ncbi:MAG: HPF/RaiA family ribosome-associated protein [Phycisphaerae bacterium]|nr:HPF/RaiA family ribosome-associated protein [Phycisphaerae bacterium]